MMNNEVLKIGSRVTAMPIIHGSGDFAWEVRRLMNRFRFDCVAVPLPESFQPQVEQSILQLPVPSAVLQKARPELENEFRPSNDELEWRPRAEDGESKNDELEELDSINDFPEASYVPIDPCQGVIAAIRTAMGEHIPRKFIDLETNRFEPYTSPLPDAYALKRVPIDQFAAAVLPHIRPPVHQQGLNRIQYMAWQLKQLSVDYENILFVCSVLDWPWIRHAFMQKSIPEMEHEPVDEPSVHEVRPDTLFFMLGELPYITGLYEQARSELGDDSNLAIDGVKELLLESRDAYQKEYKNRARKITPKTLGLCLKYLRNLTLIEHQLTPQLTTIVTAAKQFVGDGFAMQVLEKAKEYPFQPLKLTEEIGMGIDQASLPDGDVVHMVNRLPGPPIHWFSIKLTPKPDDKTKKDWQQRWNPYSQCSWPAEDEVIENFRSTVFDRAMEVMGEDLARTEKFTTSIKDGIDIRDTLRHWYDKQIYVKVLPPDRGRLDTAVMLFDSPADPREYPWRTTWFAEHMEESTLAFFATDFRSEPIGPGICSATYGGAMFVYPPVAIPDIWEDTRLDFATTIEERLLAGACLHSECPHIALVSSAPPGPVWRRLAKKYGKKWVHLPLSRFSDSTIGQLRIVHVLNGKEVRSYAADFIRRV